VLAAAGVLGDPFLCGEEQIKTCGERNTAMPTSTREQRTPEEDPNKARFRLYIGAGLLVIVGIGFLTQLPGLLEVCRGPRRLTEAEVLKFGDGGPLTKDYISYDAIELTETGLGVTSKIGDTKEQLVSRYVLVPIGNRWALAVVPKKHTGNRLVGYVTRLDQGDQITSEARNDVVKKFPNQPLAPFYFRTDNPWVQVVAWLLCLALFFGMGVWLCFSGLGLKKRRSDAQRKRNDEQLAWDPDRT
jgi:hypothetical protein